MPERVDVVVDAVSLACWVNGPTDAPAMVLLHGLGEQSSTWEPVTASLHEPFRTLAIDLRGHGDSGRPGTYSLQLMCDDVLGVVDQLDLQQITLVGHSLGGSVAYLVAEQQPARVARLIVEDAAPPLPTHRDIPERPDWPVPFDWAVLIDILGEESNPDPAWWERLSEISARTLLIGGGPSSTTSQERLTDVLARVPDCTMVTIPVGHHIHAARPAEFAAEIDAWLRH